MITGPRYFNVAGALVRISSLMHYLADRGATPARLGPPDPDGETHVVAIELGRYATAIHAERVAHLARVATNLPAGDSGLESLSSEFIPNRRKD